MKLLFSKMWSNKEVAVNQLFCRIFRNFNFFKTYKNFLKKSDFQQSRKNLRQFLRYNLVQILCYLIEMAIFLILFEMKKQLFFANFYSKIISAIMSFFAHKYFSFEKNRNHNLTSEMLRYGALVAVNLVFNSLFLLFLSQFIIEWLAKIISDICCVFINFILVRKIVFNYTK